MARRDPALDDLLAAREFLLEQLWTAAKAVNVNPDSGPKVYRDSGPWAPSGIADGRSRDYACSVGVAVADPYDMRTPRQHVDEIVRALTGLGWSIRPVSEDGAGVLTDGVRDGGFGVMISHGKDSKVSRVVGQTPTFRLARPPEDQD